MTAYAKALATLHARIADEESNEIGQAARAVADAVARGELVYVAGPGGHSQLAALDVFYRPGGLAAVSPLVDPDTSLTSGALSSTAREREAGRAARLLDDAGVREGAVLILVNAFGVNAAVIDLAVLARERGARTIIGLSSLACEDAIPSDHPARSVDGTLSRLSDIAVDTKVPPGDAAPLDNGVVLAPMATSANAFALQAILLHATALLIEEGHTPDVWSSSNLPGGDARNADLARQYSERVLAL